MKKPILFLTALIFIASGSVLALDYYGGSANKSGSGGGGSSDAQTLDGLNSSDFWQGGVCNNTATSCTDVTGIDYTCASNTACLYASSGNGQWQAASGSSTFGFFNSAVAGAPEFVIAVQDSNVSSIVNENGTTRLGWGLLGIAAGMITDQVATSEVFRVGDGVQADSTITRNAMSVYGENTIAFIPRDALSLTVTTDTASTPLGAANVGAGTACRMSSASGVTNWTPAETGMQDGMFWCCTNTGTNTITMTASSGVYEGSGAVAQWKTVCMDYVTDRIVQRSISP